MIEQRVARVLAHLLLREGVAPEAIERAVASAIDMRPGSNVSLTGDAAAPLRRAFVFEQVGRLGRR